MAANTSIGLPGNHAECLWRGFRLSWFSLDRKGAIMAPQCHESRDRIGGYLGTDLQAGKPVAVGSGRVVVQRLLGRNAGMMTGPGTNSYLIGSDCLALVDPGPVDITHIDSVLRALNGRPLGWIFVTHTHNDHSPGTALLQARTGAEVIGLEPPADAGGHQDRNFVPSRLFKDGETIDCGEFAVQLIHTPGHVSNHLCFLLLNERMLFTGDHILQGTTPVILPPDGSMADYLHSLRRLQSLPLDSLAPGHGRVMSDPQSVIETLIRHRLYREQKTLRVLTRMSGESGPVPIQSLVMGVYDDVASHLLPWAQMTLQAHLLKLQDDGRVTQLEGNWSV